jgi:hypothetical protein
MAKPIIHLPIQPDLLREAQSLAQNLNISWATLMTLALQDFIQRYRRRKNLTQQINAAYSIEPDDEDAILLKAIRSHHRNIVEGEW